MDDLKPLSKLNTSDKLLRVKKMRSDAHYANLDWLKEARTAYAFKSGDQWSEGEKQIHEEQGRESMVWNYVHPTVELVCGVLSQNPTRIRLAPVDKTDGFLCEVTEKLVEWVEENQIDSETVEDEAFEDGAITGRGFVSIDIQPRPENPTEVQFIEECVPVHQVKVDPASKKQDYSDARYLCTEKWVSLEDFAIRYPTFINKIQDIFASSSETFDDMSSLEAFQPDAFDSEDLITDYYDFDKKRVLVCQMEYFENYTRYYWVNPQNYAETKEIEAEHAKQLPQIQVIKVLAKKVKWIHFTNDIIMYDDDSPVYPDGFSTVPVFAYADKKSKQISYYGIVKPMIDPQRECNKRGMQTIRLMERQGTGVFAEEDAFVDPEQAEESWNDPDQITWLKANGMEKVKEKASLEFPAATVQLHEISKDSMKQITGINPDMMGMAGTRQEPGMVVRMRQQQGLTIINKLFRNYKKMKKYLYKRKVYLIMKYMPDWQIQKILGENDKFAIKDGMIIDKENQLMAPIRAIRDIKYNLKFEDAPGNMTKTMSELSIFLDMVAKGFPVDPQAIIDRLDISESAKQRWKKYIEQSNQSQAKAKQLEQQLIQAKMQTEAQAKTGQLQIDNSKLQLLNQKQSADIALKEKDQKLIEFKTLADQRQKQDEQKLKRAQIVLKYKELAEKKADNKRDWYLRLSQDERDNLEADLRILGTIDDAIGSEAVSV